MCNFTKHVLLEKELIRLFFQNLSKLMSIMAPHTLSSIVVIIETKP